MLQQRLSLVRNSTILALLILAGWYVPTHGLTSRLAIEDARILSSGRQAVKDIWFTSTRDLMTLTEVADRLHIRRWKIPGDYVQPVESLEVKLSLESNSPPLSQDLSLVPYRVFTDGGRVAWAWAGYIYFWDYPFKPGTAKRLPTRDRHQVADLAFAKRHLITLLYDDGKVETIDTQEERTGMAGTWVQKDWSFESRGDSELLALAFFRGAEVAWLRPGTDNIDLGFLHLPSDRGTTIAIPRTGERIAIGMDDGGVVFFPDCRNKVSLLLSLEQSRPIRALAFFSDEKIIAAGEFPGIYLLQPNSDPLRLGSSPAGIMHLAYRDRLIAYSTAQGVTVGEILEKRELNDMGRFAIALSISLISLTIALSNLFRQ